MDYAKSSVALECVTELEPPTGNPEPVKSKFFPVTGKQMPNIFNGS